MAKSKSPSTTAPAETPRPWYYPQIVGEYRKGYPYASEAEIQQLLAAEDKLGHPPKSLKEAQAVLAQKIYHE